MHILVAVSISSAGMLGLLSYWLIYVQDALVENTPASPDIHS